MAKTLHGVRVLDLTHMLSGPYGAMILADLGAETIKVEPLGGEGTRKLLATDPRHSVDGMGAYFITLNRNKQSVCIDLKCERGLQLFYDLVKESDVVLDVLDEPDSPDNPFHHITAVEYVRFDGYIWSFYPRGRPLFTPNSANYLPANFEGCPF